MAISEQERNRQRLQGFLDDKLKWHDYTHIAVLDEALAPQAHFVHTVGRARAEKPELIVTGCREVQWAIDLIADVVAHEDRAGPLAEGRLPDGAARLPVLLKDVSTDFVRQKRLAQASSRFGASIRVLQIVWADPLGHFPTEAAYDFRGSPQECLWTL